MGTTAEISDCMSDAEVKMQFGIPEASADMVKDMPGTQGSDYFREKCLPVASNVDIFGMSEGSVVSGTGHFGPGSGEVGRVEVLEAGDLSWSATTKGGTGSPSVAPIDGTTERGVLKPRHLRLRQWHLQVLHGLHDRGLLGAELARDGLSAGPVLCLGGRRGRSPRANNNNS